MKKALVIGSGAGGATVARELQERFEVTVLEAGREFRPFKADLRKIEKIKRAGLLFDEREIGLIFPSMKIRKTGDGMVLVNGSGTGGTTALATANALRLDQDLIALGIDLGREFEELGREVPITAAHQRKWSKITRLLFRTFEEMGLEPRPMPKMGYFEDCTGCGRCVLGCPNGIKWDSREFLRSALGRGATLRTGVRAARVVIEGGKAAGVEARTGLRREFIPADVVVLAAGGLGTPRILEMSGIPSEPRLFVDPVLCVAAPWKNAGQNADLPMPFFVRRENDIISPYFDHLSYFFNADWKPPAGDILSLMIKLADEDTCAVGGRKADKVLTGKDRERLKDAVDVCIEAFRRLGVKKGSLFFGTLNAGHPGGALPLLSSSAATFHDSRLPENLYVADASLLPRSLGGPPILTIMAMAKRVARIVSDGFAQP
jgi:choline dehydrogenase-like flavoprotein